MLKRKENVDTELQKRLNGWVKESKWDDKCYFEYLELMNRLKNDLKIKDPAQIELYMFDEGEKLAENKEKKKNANLKDNS